MIVTLDICNYKMSIVQRHKSPPVWGNQTQKVRVSANDKKNVTKNLNIFPIDLLPLEILYLIIERLDADTLVNCLHVSNKWKSIVLSLANADKVIFLVYLEKWLAS